MPSTVGISCVPFPSDGRPGGARTVPDDTPRSFPRIAVECGAPLITRDRRALGTYRALDVDVMVLQRSGAAGTAAVFLLINLPFMIVGWSGWWASFQFQWIRPIDLTTNTIWFWGARPYTDSSNTAVQHDLATIATVTTLAALLLACVLGWWRFRRDRPTRGCRCARQWSAGTCCSTRCTRPSSRSGCCRSSCCCGSGPAGSWPTSSPTPRSGTSCT